jgi:hypothetical protein
MCSLCRWFSHFNSGRKLPADPNPSELLFVACIIIYAGQYYLVQNGMSQL